MSSLPVTPSQPPQYHTGSEIGQIFHFGHQEISFNGKREKLEWFNSNKKDRLSTLQFYIQLVPEIPEDWVQWGRLLQKQCSMLLEMLQHFYLQIQASPAPTT